MSKEIHFVSSKDKTFLKFGSPVIKKEKPNWGFGQTIDIKICFKIRVFYVWGSFTPVE
jgi:hypothetical protein